MAISKTLFGSKRLFGLLAAFLFGWFSARTTSRYPAFAELKKLDRLCSSEVSPNSPLSFLMPKRWSFFDTKCDQYTSRAFYRESLRRRSINTVGYISKIALANLSRIQKITDSGGAVEQMGLIKNFLSQSTLYLLANLRKMEELDDARLCRREALNQLSNLVQTRIKALQNPPDCTRAKILLADVSWPCGYGCHTHYFMFCLNMAYATGRTLISESLTTYCGKWWASSYMPFSDKCSMENIGKNEAIVGMNSANFNSTARVMRCTFGFFVHAQNVSVAPPAVPRDLAPLLLTLHGQPGVWFLGQLAYYIMRPLPMFKSQLDDLALSSKLSKNHDSPVVGVHVRRTDKVSYHEGEFHNISEYMVHVDRYFDYIDEMRLTGGERNGPKESRVKRQIYLASDDPTVFKDMKTQYPHYVVHNTTRKKFIEAAGRRYPTDSRTHIAMEIFLLSRTDYIVCTLSSNVCRVAYELMQTRHNEIGDAGDLVQTIDTSYFWDSGQTIKCQMIQDEESMNLHRGDVVDVWSGNLNALFEHQRLKNKTHFVDPSYKCVLQTVIG